MKYRLLLIAPLLALLFMFACALPPAATLQTMYPAMYSSPPASILILPPMNNSTAADAKEYFACSLAEAVGRKGYYVLPVEAMFGLLRDEGMYDSENISPIVLQNFNKHFGADAALFTTIEEWNKSWFLTTGSLTIKAKFELVSTSTAESIWDFSTRITVNLDSESKNVLVAMIESAVKTAMEDYFPNCLQANISAMDRALPYGKYHPQFNMDGSKMVPPNKFADIEIEK